VYSWPRISLLPFRQPRPYRPHRRSRPHRQSRPLPSHRSRAPGPARLSRYEAL